MAGEDFGELLEGFDMLGQLVEGITRSEYAMYFLVLTVISVLFATLLRALLSKVPMFEGEGDKKVNGFGNTIAWCISLLSVMSIGWGMRDKSTEYVVTTLSGPYGGFMIFLGCITLAYCLYKGMEAYYKWVRIVFAAVPTGFLYLWFLKFSADVDYLSGYVLLCGIAFIVGFLILAFGKDD